MNFYKRHIGDYLRDAGHLSLLEHGVYTRLLDVYYTREAGIPDVHAERLVGARSKDEISAVRAVLSEFFELIDGVWRQKRCDKEIQTASEKADRNRVVGKLGGRPGNFSRGNVPHGSKPSINPEITQMVSTNTDSGNPEEPQKEPKQNPSQTPDSRHQTPKAEAIGANAPHSAEPSGAPPPAGQSPPAGRSADVRSVFEHWKTACGHPTAKLGESDSKRYRAISNRLKDGYTVEQLCRAVDGVLKSPHHQGENDRGEVYDDIELICRDGGHVDKFIRLADSAQNGKLSAAGRKTVSSIETWLESKNAA